MSFYRAPTSVHPSSPIQLTSPDLLDTAGAIDARKEDRKKFGEEYRRLAKLDRPDIGPGVTRYERPVTKSTIDLTDRRAAPGKLDTAGAIDEAAQRAEDVARIERGEDIGERPDIKTQMNHVARKAQATEAVIEKLEEEFRVEFLKLSAEYCKTLRPRHDEQMKLLFKALLEVQTVHSEIYDTCRDLIDSSVGFHGVYGLTPTFLGNPRDRHSDFAEFLREGHKLGYVANMPEFA
jgi:hypothetical protein